MSGGSADSVAVERCWLAVLRHVLNTLIVASRSVIYAGHVLVRPQSDERVRTHLCAILKLYLQFRERVHLHIDICSHIEVSA